MKKIKITKELFNLSSPLSDGLISGFKMLCENNFAIEISNYEKNVDPVIQNILALEKVEINVKVENEYEVYHKLSVQKKKKGRKGSIILDDEKEFSSFESAVNFLLKLNDRISKHVRKTKETDISVYVNIDGKGESSIFTGVGFFDHMLEQIAKHGNIDLEINVKGDLFVDEHHTVEDVGITLGTALNEALGEKRGIKRYSFFLPMDETIAKCAIDLSGRAFLNFKCDFKREKVGDFPTELAEDFFRGLASGMKANIYLRSKGRNDHHKLESLFKAFAKSLNEACRFDERTMGRIPSTKEKL